MKTPRLITLFTLALIASSTAANAEGIQLGRTRVIYDANKKEASLPLINSEKELPWLIQSWVMNADNKTRAPFIITPPLFRLDPKSEQTLRIMKSENITQTNVESLYYLIVRMIPASDRQNQQSNVLNIIYKTQIKLFYRPKGLEGSADDACKNLHFSQSGKQLTIENTSHFYTVFSSLTLGSSKVQADMVAPQSSVTLPLNAPIATSSASWHCINDYGGETVAYTAALSS
ncbi:MAG: molecular chaperone [Kluyvera cryocrescens]|uniref:Molecular chaperone n=1 Tax=Kluyvera cryocrescens TaxID=580 RepID=A0AAW9C689_KLUCR|nr:molecular chaperone [Kluyvera cryocrescens]MCX2869554.1 molecular chaperone [Kluyvera cryocrescens]MDU5687589.1 molecular chaperone [Kluyvera cryocrescens]MDW3776675.1 molecular chaperone [Kluyvera cryocrescens]MEB7712940.1 molecular chaperone [Kluyvera cryocrescens]WNN73446.1 molecular chaperone [Kluyvera cryocrescens]